MTPNAARASLLLLVGLAGCHRETLLVVNVLGKDGVISPKTASTRTRVMGRLEATFIHEEQPSYNIFSQGGAAIELPTAFVLRAEGREGPVQVELKAHDDNQVLGRGSGRGTLVKEQEGELSVTLYPDDFGVNENRTNRQFFSTEAGFGRHVSASRGGNFVVVWEDNCGPLKRCDIWYRLFDNTGTPRLNYTGQTREQTANEGNDIYDMPSVAVQDGGGFLIAWQRTVGTSFKIYSRTFTADGQPDPASNSGNEVELSGTEVTTGTTPSVPHAIALRDGGYLVVWQQSASANNWEIKARLLTKTGVPAVTYNASTLPFLVHSFTSAKRPWPVAAPAVQKGKEGAFLVVWNEDGVIRGRPFGPRAVPLKAPFDVDSTKTRQAQEPSVAPMETGYAIAWSDTISGSSRIRVRRVDFNGAPPQTGELEYTLSTSGGNHTNPAIAMRGDGSLLCVWASDNSTLDPDGGIRGRKLLKNLLAVGEDFPINTTTTAKQEAPSLTAFPDSESFVTVFVDASREYPDRFDTGIRARLLYPDYDVVDGQLGSRCDGENGLTCAEELSCQNTTAGQRCVMRCPTPGKACDSGGVCKKLSAGDQVCLL